MDCVKATIEKSTQWFKHEGCEHLRAACKTQFPTANVEHLNETVACDTLFSDTPVHDDGLNGHGGCEMVQLFVGTTSHLTDTVPMPAKSAFQEALKEFIQKWGAPAKVMSDNAWEQTSSKVLDIWCHHNITKCNSEAGQQSEPESW